MTTGMLADRSSLVRLEKGQAGRLDAEGVCAWFGGRLVLEAVT